MNQVSREFQAVLSGLATNPRKDTHARSFEVVEQAATDWLLPYVETFRASIPFPKLSGTDLQELTLAILQQTGTSSAEKVVLQLDTAHIKDFTKTNLWVLSLITQLHTRLEQENAYNSLTNSITNGQRTQATEKDRESLLSSAVNILATKFYPDDQTLQFLIQTVATQCVARFVGQKTEATPKDKAVHIADTALAKLVSLDDTDKQAFRDAINAAFDAPADAQPHIQAAFANLARELATVSPADTTEERQINELDQVKQGILNQITLAQRSQQTSEAEHIVALHERLSVLHEDQFRAQMVMRARVAMQTIDDTLPNVPETAGLLNDIKATVQRELDGFTADAKMAPETFAVNLSTQLALHGSHIQTSIETKPDSRSMLQKFRDFINWVINVNFEPEITKVNRQRQAVRESLTSLEQSVASRSLTLETFSEQKSSMTPTMSF